MRPFVSKFAIAMFLSASVSACGRSNTEATAIGSVCVVLPAISVTVRDSVSGRALADGATGTLRNGEATGALFHRDSLRLTGGGTVGTYDVTIERAGYRTWTRTGVQVNQSLACGGPVTVELTAPLQPAPLAASMRPAPTAPLATDTGAPATR
jgi:hypothetical protein